MNVTLKMLCSLFYILYPMNFQLKVRSKFVKTTLISTGHFFDLSKYSIVKPVFIE